jgi:hypothetical protein
MASTVQSIFQDHFDPWLMAHPQPLHKIKAARAIMQCRTETLGGHVQRCPHGHVEKVWYNSCKHPSCPRCSALASERWLDKVKAKLLACDHYHAIFTLPHQLNDLWWNNNALMADLLFHAAIDTLKELLGDDQYLGALPGMIACLHTWGRNLSRHPHLHVLISGGGWTGKAWKEITNGHLLPFKVVRKLFAGRYIAALRKARRQGELELPRDLTPRKFQALLNRLAGQVKWNVRICERYAHGEGVVKYLADYLQGGPVNNGQIEKNPEQNTKKEINLSYTDHRDHERKKLALTPQHFIQRLLWHIPEPRQQRVRYYGLYHPKKEEIRGQCREHLGQEPEQEPEFLDWQSYLERIGKPQPTRCPECNARLITTEIVAPRRQRERGPPTVKLRPGCADPLTLPPDPRMSLPLPLPKAA